MLTDVEHIGDGGFGTVYRVVDDFGNEFAKKTFAKNQPLTTELLENVLRRFEKEVRIQSSISHPNIVPILSSDLSTYPPSYVMPLAALSLADELERDRSVEGRFISAISDIVAALDELHSMQIYHRDLKPQNVLRFDDSGGVRYAISDFGLVSLKESSLSGLTRTGMRKSSDHYTAPEIARDLKSASAASDIYSLGCILHDMVGTEDRVPCGEIREPGEFAAILLGCTRRDPAARFKSARDVLDAILSVDFTASVPPSLEAGSFVELLDGTAAPTSESWERLAEFIEHSDNENDLKNIFLKLDADNIQRVCADAPSAADRICIRYAHWIAESSFSFEYCDALAYRLHEFFNGTNYEAKVECIVTLLRLGTSHNRWFVERKFVSLCSSDMDDNLAKRLAIQLRIVGNEVCSQIRHLESSINYDRQNLHPSIVKALRDLCP